MAEFTIAQIAARIGISERTARRWIETGTIKTEPGRRRGYYRVDLHELEQKTPTLVRGDTYCKYLLQQKG